MKTSLEESFAFIAGLKSFGAFLHSLGRLPKTKLIQIDEALDRTAETLDSFLMTTTTATEAERKQTTDLIVSGLRRCFFIDEARRGLQ